MPTATQDIDVFAGTRALVLGGGISGRSAAIALDDAGARTLVADSRPQVTGDFPNASKVVASPNLGYLIEQAEAFDPHYVVTSPGLAPTFELLQWAQARGLTVMSEVELAWRMATPATKWFMVTGTNGKTTTTGMAAAILKADGMHAPAVGNIGLPIALTVLAGRSGGQKLDALAVEISSFQLHFTSTVSPHSSVCLNVADDHLDWHGGREEYFAAKARVYEHVQYGCIYPADDRLIEGMVEAADVVEGARAIGYTLQTPARSQVGLVEGAIVDRAHISNRATHGQVVAELSDLAHLGDELPPHVVIDALAATALVRSVAAPAAVREGLRSFELADHRMQFVATKGGVRYVNDSKATNTHASQEALRSFDRGQVVWIVGGLTKGADVGQLIADYADRLAAVVVIGQDQGPFLEALSRHAPTIRVVSVDPREDEVMPRAVAYAADLAVPGQTVLLSPASASMDQFTNYEERGNQFMAAVGELN